MTEGGAGRRQASPLPEPNTSVRGIAAAHSAIVLTTHRGLYRSADGGRTWQLEEGMLPIHLEAGPLARDPADPATLYAGFALTPYDEIWRMATKGGTMLGRLSAVSLAGGAAFLLVRCARGDRRAPVARTVLRQGRAGRPSSAVERGR